MGGTGMDPKIVALVIFLITYLCLLIFSKIRAYIAIGAAVVFVVLGQIGILPVYNYLGVIDWNVIMMIAGTMGVVALFIESKMPSKLADIILDKVPNVQWAMVWLALFAGIISAFVDNVATVLMVAPVALNISR
jgi:Na+/H+ antiporter NhaD/arsenite permease-like protein